MFIPLFIGYYTSQVVQDFSHQPYHPYYIASKPKILDEAATCMDITPPKDQTSTLVRAKSTGRKRRKPGTTPGGGPYRKLSLVLMDLEVMDFFQPSLKEKMSQIGSFPHV